MLKARHGERNCAWRSARPSRATQQSLRCPDEIAQLGARNVSLLRNGEACATCAFSSNDYKKPFLLCFFFVRLRQSFCRFSKFLLPLELASLTTEDNSFPYRLCILFLLLLALLLNLFNHTCSFFFLANCSVFLSGSTLLFVFPFFFFAHALFLIFFFFNFYFSL